MPRRLLGLAAIGAVIALLAAGCGGKPSTSSSVPTTMAATSGTTVAVASSKLGKILVDGQGRTLYLFEKDQGNKSMCSGGCVAAWPPLITKGAPKAGMGTTATMLATTDRGNGLTQVTYNSHPLYRFSGDTKVGDVRGQGLTAFGAEWYVVGPNGNKVETKPS